jgi:hypothetical protein
MDQTVQATSVLKPVADVDMEPEERGAMNLEETRQKRHGIGVFFRKGGSVKSSGAYIQRGAQFIGDKFDDIDAYLSEKAGMEERAAFKKGIRQGLKDEGYKKGGSVKKTSAVKKVSTGSSASKRADGIAVKGKTKGRFV